MSYPGQCTSKCAGCGAGVFVPTAGGCPPWIEHKLNCPNAGMSVQDATRNVRQRRLATVTKRERTVGRG